MHEQVPLTSVCVVDDLITHNVVELTIGSIYSFGSERHSERGQNLTTGFDQKDARTRRLIDKPLELSTFVKTGLTEEHYRWGLDHD